MLVLSVFILRKCRVRWFGMLKRGDMVVTLHAVPDARLLRVRVGSG
jgi:hypothetical protein